MSTLMAGKVAAACMLRVCSGRVWVTQEGLTEDFWIEGGDALILQPGGLIVIEATVVSLIAIESLAVDRASWMRSFGAVLPRLLPGKA